MWIALLACLGLVVLSFFLVGLTFKLLWMALIGFVIGALAKAVLPGKEDLSFGMTILLGFGGSLAGNLLAAVLGIQAGALIGFGFSIVGALAILGIYRQVVKSS